MTQRYDPAPTTTWRSWLVWGVAVLFVAYQFGMQVSVSAMDTPLRRGFGIGVESIAWLTAAFYIAYALMQVPAGLLIDRFNIRWLMAGALLLFAAAAGGFALAQGMAEALTARAVMGVVASAGFVGAVVLARRWFAPAIIAMVVGATETMGYLGGAVGQAGVEQLTEAVGWRGTMWIAALIAAAIGVLVFLVVRPYPAGARSALGLAGSDGRPRVFDALKEVLSSPTIWLCGWIYGVGYGALISFAGLWDVGFAQAAGESLAVATRFDAAAFIGMAIGSPLLGYLSDRLGRRVGLMRMGAIGALASVAAIFYVPHHGHVLHYTWMFTFGFSCGASVLAFSYACERLGAHVQGLVVGVINGLATVVGVLLQIVPGWLLPADDARATVGEYRVAMVVFVVAMAIGVACTFVTRERR